MVYHFDHRVSRDINRPTDHEQFTPYLLTTVVYQRTLTGKVVSEDLEVVT